MAGRFLALLLLPSLASAVFSTARSATFCVETATELENALITADSNGQPDEINIAKGTYSTTDGFEYVAGASEIHGLILRGGWSQNCTFPETFFPFDTQLGRTTQGTILYMETVSGDIQIDRLHFANSTSGLAPLAIFALNNSAGVEIMIDRSVFSGNFSMHGALWLNGLRNDEVRIRSSLFRDNHSSQFAAIRIDADDDSRVYFINNTVISNTIPFSPMVIVGGLYLSNGLLFGGAEAQALIVNNIFWNNDGADLYLNGAGRVLLKNSNIEDLTGAPDESVQNVSIDPMFEPNSYRPAFDSAMVDAGTKPRNPAPFPIPFEDDWTLGGLDFDGFPRVRGNNGSFSRVDIGAAEAFPEFIFSDGYE